MKAGHTTAFALFAAMGGTLASCTPTAPAPVNAPAPGSAPSRLPSNPGGAWHREPSMPVDVDALDPDPVDPDPVDPVDPDPTDCGAMAPGYQGSDTFGLTTQPPQMALADSFYTYDLRTTGACEGGSVWWRLEDAPVGARLEVAGSEALLPGEEREHSGGGHAEARVAWDLRGVSAGCYAFAVRFRAQSDCAAFDEGEEVEQRWQLAVRSNDWWSGDLHVHTKHSEGGDEAGSFHDYARRAKNLATDAEGRTFADRRRRSLRGGLHWIVFSDHTDREHEECGRHFAPWCPAGASVEDATGRDVAAALVEADPSVLLVVGSEVSNLFGGHLGFFPKNPFPGHPYYAPGYFEDATDYDFDVGFGVGVFRERWQDLRATNAEEIALIQQLGGLAIVNHQSAPLPWIAYDWSSLAFDGLEVWNGGLRHDSHDDAAFNGALDLNRVTEDNALTAEIRVEPVHRSWIGMLKLGRWPLALAGGSDTHAYDNVVCFDGPCDPTSAELANPTTTVRANSFVWANGNDGIADAFAAGRTVVHDAANFIDLRIVHAGREHQIGDTIGAYAAGAPLSLRAFGRVADFVDGDNRVLVILGTSGDPDDRRVDVLYSSEDDEHFVSPIRGRDHMRYLRPDSSFDRAWETSLSVSQLGENGRYFIWAQFIPWHNPLYLEGNGQDMALTGAVRVITGG